MHSLLQAPSAIADAADVTTRKMASSRDADVISSRAVGSESKDDVTSLSDRAARLGVSFLLPCIGSAHVAPRAQIIPVDAARQLEERGFGIHGHGHFVRSFAKPKMSAVPDVTTLVRLPWDHEIGWLAW